MREEREMSADELASAIKIELAGTKKDLKRTAHIKWKYSRHILEIIVGQVTLGNPRFLELMTKTKNNLI